MVTEKQESPDIVRRPRRVTQIALVLLILFSGMLIGSAGTILLLRQRMIRVQRHDRPAVYGSVVASKIRQRYDLTDREAEAVERAFSKRIHAVAELRRQFLTQFNVVRGTFRSDLQETLPAAKYERVKAHLDARRKWFRWFFGVSKELQEDSLDGLLKDPNQGQSQ